MNFLKLRKGKGLVGYALFIFLAVMQAQRLPAQSFPAEKVTIRANKQTVGNVFKEITRQTGIRFFYSEAVVTASPPVDLDVKNAALSQVLSEIARQTALSFARTDNTVSVSAGNRGKQQGQPAAPPKKISGIVKDARGEPVIGANVIEKGTANGVITDLDGRFALETVPEATLQISYIGYATRNIRVGASSVFTVVLHEDTEKLEEVVVTALGIKREEKALGYAVQKVQAEGLTSAKGVDFSSSLTGKVAGLNIQNSTEFNETPILKLRGETPLLIIDGVPYDNMTINDVAADDIESISVLKGATASALYGARGGSGAVMVTTKKGTGREGLNVSVNSNTLFFAGYLAFPEVQSSYSAGTGGRYNNNSVWGDKLDIGRTAVMWNPYTYEMEEQELVSKGKDNFKNLLQFSLVTNNNVSVSQKGKYGSFRTSVTQVYNRGQYPNQDLNKVTVSVGGEMTYKKFKLEAAASYNKRISSNDYGSGYSNSYIYDVVIWGGTEYDLRDYRDYWIKGKEHVQQNWYDRNWYDNPYFKANEVIHATDYDVMNISVNGTYELNPWLKVMVRSGLDTYNRKEKWRNAVSANYAWEKKGYYGLGRDNRYSVNTDAMLTADKTWGKFNLNVMAGGNIYYAYADNLTSQTKGGITIPGFYSLKASVDPVESSSELKRKRVNSLYGKLSLAWASTYFLDVTGRNDWSSTLPSATRSYFYPSVAGSVVLSEIVPLPEVWNFWKVRGAWTETKQDMDIYANNNVYEIETNVWNGLMAATYPKTLIGADVCPQSSSTFEVGTAVNFFKNRLFADVAYFRKIEKNFITDGGISEATGFRSIQTNSKEERLRKGFEVTVGGTPVQTEDFRWDILTNWAHDRYLYHRIDPEYSNKKPWVKEGERWDWIEIYDWDRDPQGNIIHSGGIPVKQSFKTKVGCLGPDLVWGITNTLKYKEWQLSFTIDGRVGGMSYSRTHQMLWNAGVHKDSDNRYRYDEVVNGKQTYIGEGVKVVEGEVKRDSDGNVLEDTRVFAPNDVVVSYEGYITKYHDATSKPSRQNVLDETFFKLRNLSLTYALPSDFCKKMRLHAASVGVTGQNLFLWAKEYKYADPDKGGSSDSGDYGYESLNSPSQRYVGVNIKVDF